MVAAPHFSEFVAIVVTSAREITPRSMVELGVLHGFCVDAACRQAPELVDFLNTIGGFEALAFVLSQMPDMILPADIGGKMWQFVRPAAEVDEATTLGMPT